ncbi:MAG: CcmD family protein [Acidobacteriota bacterium]|nr:CcmD family protein [Acidobacteriota bacterium]
MIEARNFLYLFYGLAAAWLIVIGYILYLVSRDRKLSRELGRLKNLMSEREKTEL